MSIANNDSAKAATMSSTEQEKLFSKLFITTSEVCDRVGVSRAAVAQCKANGKLPEGFNIGTTTVWLRETLEPSLAVWENERLLK